MKKLNRLLTVLTAAAILFGFASCANNVTVAEKLVPGNSGEDYSNYCWYASQFICHFNSNNVCDGMIIPMSTFGGTTSVTLVPESKKSAAETLYNSASPAGNTASFDKGTDGYTQVKALVEGVSTVDIDYMVYPEEIISAYTNVLLESKEAVLTAGYTFAEGVDTTNIKIIINNGTPGCILDYKSGISYALSVSGDNEISYDNDEESHKIAVDSIDFKYDCSDCTRVDCGYSVECNRTNVKLINHADQTSCFKGFYKTKSGKYIYMDMGGM